MGDAPSVPLTGLGASRGGQEGAGAAGREARGKTGKQDGKGKRVLRTPLPQRLCGQSLSAQVLRPQSLPGTRRMGIGILGLLAFPWCQYRAGHTFSKITCGLGTESEPRPHLHPQSGSPPEGFGQSPGGSLTVLWAGAAVLVGFWGRQLIGSVPLSRTCREWSRIGAKELCPAGTGRRNGGDRRTL